MDLLTLATALITPLPEVAILHAIAQLPSLVLARARAARHNRAPRRAPGELDIDLDGRIAPRINDLAGVNIGDGGE
jgi:hypothetical protein